ncbi:MAG: ribosome maturation factor RimM [Oscillospiraceae bacterium]|jgi:16S rRNA processing protein RimM|nr:ribosome maturation factor RimM [Oscillospiraceae bacterium]
MKDYLIIGKLIGAHGVAGELKVFPITDDARRFSNLTEIMLLNANEKPVRNLKILSTRPAGNNILCTAEGIKDRESAQALFGHYIAVPRADAVVLPENSYFIADLIGSRVIDDERGLLGGVSDVLEQSGADVFIVSREQKKDILIPFLKTIVYRVDIENKEIFVRLPDGLFEIYET